MTNEQERFDQMKVTSQLKEILENNPHYASEEAVMAVFRAMLFYEEQFKHFIAIYGVTTATKAIYSAFKERDESFTPEEKKLISCTAGCSHCCHIRVEVSECEAVTILDYCEQNNIPLNVERLKMHNNVDIKQRTRLKESACAFLEEKTGMCKIYDVRPTNCRKYYVVSPPDECNARKYFHNRVTLYADTDMEVMASALVNLGSRGELSNMILKQLTLKHIKNAKAKKCSP